MTALWMLVWAWLAMGQSLQRPEVPGSLKAPASEDLVLIARAEGVQIYACVKNPKDEYRWELQGPKAELFDADKKPIGKHYADTAGPAWESADGSKFVGKKVSAHSVSQAIPWLLLQSVGNKGSGILSRVRTIQRLHTEGGLEPGSACDAAHAGSRSESPYKADYYFYAPSK